MNRFTIRCRGKLTDLSKPLVMGIINITDDSFFAESRTRELHHIVERAGDMLQQGAAMLDIGAQSTRPGAPETGPDKELERLLPALHAILHPCRRVHRERYQRRRYGSADAAHRSQTTGSVHRHAYERHSCRYAEEPSV